MQKYKIILEHNQRHFLGNGHSLIVFVYVRFCWRTHYITNSSVLGNYSFEKVFAEFY